MTRKVVLAILLVLLVAGGLGGIKAMQIRKLLAAAKAFKQPPETISSVTAHEEKWQTSLTAIGSVITAQGVTITPEIAGTISEILFESGAEIGRAHV